MHINLSNIYQKKNIDNRQNIQPLFIIDNTEDLSNIKLNPKQTKLNNIPKPIKSDNNNP